MALTNLREICIQDIILLLCAIPEVDIDSYISTYYTKNSYDGAYVDNVLTWELAQD